MAAPGLTRRSRSPFNDEVVGLIPCGGHATRIAPLPCSKEIVPVGLQRAEDGSPRVKVVSHYLLEKMQHAGIRRAYLVLRDGKWDIPAYYGSGEGVGLDLAYLVARLPYGPPFTLDQAYPFVRGARIAMGFPDILFGPRDAFVQALQRLTTTRTDIVLGLFRPRDACACDMVDLDRHGEVHDLLLKPRQTTLTWSWMFAVWTPAFTEFMHGYLAAPRTAPQQPGAGLPQELTVGHVLQAAIRDGMRTQSVAFRRHDYLDIGTPPGLHESVASVWLDGMDVDKSLVTSEGAKNDDARVDTPGGASTEDEKAAVETRRGDGAAVHEAGAVAGRADIASAPGALPRRL